jgi:site-specific DNA-methyltransferase (adenine-specific)
MVGEPRWRSPLTGSEVFEADALTVAEGLPAGCASLAILDGPYGMGKAEWDRVPRGGRLADLYRPHLEALGRVCAASATVYLWNTAEGWAELHAEMLGRGWRFAGLLTWDKGDGFMAGKCDVRGLRGWYDVTEVCGMYQREAWNPTCAVRSMRAASLRPADIDAAAGVACVASRKWLGADRQAYAPDAGDLARVRAVLPQLDGPWKLAEPRPVFSCPLGVSNVWREPTVAGPERLRDGQGRTLHPCQKPLLFADRMLRASSRPGDVVWVPFGGTLRELVAAERMARQDRAEARRVVTCELNADGVDYIGAALAQVQGLPALAAGQVGLFG